MHSVLRNGLSFVLACLACVACAPASSPTDADPSAASGSETGGELSVGEPGVPAYGPLCGGIAGFSCPGAGVCADDPRDACDPAHGGADCGGVCTCEPTVLCAPGTVFDGSPEVCACIAQEGRDDVCARVRCADGTRCVSHDGSARCEPTD